MPYDSNFRSAAILSALPDVYKNPGSMLPEFIRSFVSFLNTSKIVWDRSPGLVSSGDIFVLSNSVEFEVIAITEENEWFVRSSEGVEPQVGDTSLSGATIVEYQRNPAQATESVELDKSVAQSRSNVFNNVFSPLLAPDFNRLRSEQEQRYFVERAKELYQEKGIEQAFEFILREAFDASQVDFSYPSTNLLRTSDGTNDEMVVTYFLRTDGNFDYGPEEIIGLNIRGLSGGATARVESVIRQYIENAEIIVILLSNVIGEFAPEEIVESFSSSIVDSSGQNFAYLRFFVGGGVTQIRPVSGGDLYSVGDQVVVPGFHQLPASGVVTETTNTGISGVEIIQGGTGYAIGDPVLFTGIGRFGEGARGVVDGITDVYTKDGLAAVTISEFASSNIDSIIPVQGLLGPIPESRVTHLYANSLFLGDQAFLPLREYDQTGIIPVTGTLLFGEQSNTNSAVVFYASDDNERLLLRYPDPTNNVRFIQGETVTIPELSDEYYLLGLVAQTFATTITNEQFLTGASVDLYTFGGVGGSLSLLSGNTAVFEFLTRTRQYQNNLVSDGSFSVLSLNSSTDIVVSSTVTPYNGMRVIFGNIQRTITGVEDLGGSFRVILNAPFVSTLSVGDSIDYSGSNDFIVLPDVVVNNPSVGANNTLTLSIPSWRNIVPGQDTLRSGGETRSILSVAGSIVTVNSPFTVAPTEVFLPGKILTFTDPTPNLDTEALLGTSFSANVTVSKIISDTQVTVTHANTEPALTVGSFFLGDSFVTSVNRLSTNLVFLEGNGSVRLSDVQLQDEFGVETIEFGKINSVSITSTGFGYTIPPWVQAISNYGAEEPTYFVGVSPNTLSTSNSYYFDRVDDFGVVRGTLLEQGVTLYEVERVFGDQFFIGEGVYDGNDLVGNVSHLSYTIRMSPAGVRSVAGEILVEEGQTARGLLSGASGTIWRVENQRNGLFVHVISTSRRPFFDQETVEFSNAGGVVASTQILTSENYLPAGRNSHLVVNANGFTTSSISSVDVTNPGYGLTQVDIENAEVIRTDGSGATFEVDLSGSVILEGHGRPDVSGYLSESQQVLRDGHFYQEYSYVIKSDVSLSEYEELVKTLLHPAGLRLFGEITFETVLDVEVFNSWDPPRDINQVSDEGFFNYRNLEIDVNDLRLAEPSTIEAVKPNLYSPIVTPHAYLGDGVHEYFLDHKSEVVDGLGLNTFPYADGSVGPTSNVSDEVANRLPVREWANAQIDLHNPHEIEITPDVLDSTGPFHDSDHEIEDETIFDLHGPNIRLNPSYYTFKYQFDWLDAIYWRQYQSIEDAEADLIQQSLGTYSPARTDPPDTNGGYIEFNRVQNQFSTEIYPSNDPMHRVIESGLDNDGKNEDSTSPIENNAGPKRVDEVDGTEANTEPTLFVLEIKPPIADFNELFAAITDYEFEIGDEITSGNVVVSSVVDMSIDGYPDKIVYREFDIAVSAYGRKTDVKVVKELLSPVGVSHIGDHEFSRVTELPVQITADSIMVGYFETMASFPVLFVETDYRVVPGDSRATSLTVYGVPEKVDKLYGYNQARTFKGFTPYYKFGEHVSWIDQIGAYADEILNGYYYLRPNLIRYADVVPIDPRNAQGSFSNQIIPPIVRTISSDDVQRSGPSGMSERNSIPELFSVNSLQSKAVASPEPSESSYPETIAPITATSGDTDAFVFTDTEWQSRIFSNGMLETPTPLAGSIPVAYSFLPVEYTVSIDVANTTTSLDGGVNNTYTVTLSENSGNYFLRMGADQGQIILNPVRDSANVVYTISGAVLASSIN